MFFHGPNLGVARRRGGRPVCNFGESMAFFLYGRVAMYCSPLDAGLGVRFTLLRRKR